MASARTLSTRHKATASHLEALGYVCKGTRDSGGRTYWVFDYSPEIREAVAEYEAAFGRVQNAPPVSSPQYRPVS